MNPTAADPSTRTTAVPDGPGAPMLRQALAALCEFFQTLTPSTLNGLGQHYAEGATFKDPFNEVVGVPAIEAIFGAMFRQLDEPRFVVRSTLMDGSRACIVWDLEFRFKGAQPAQMQRIHGASWLEFDSSGKVVRHRDYWDAAEELYEKIPVLGTLMRFLRRRLAH